MWLWIIQITLISIILIFLVHHLVNFLKATLTIPKIKDLVNSPSQKYEDIYNIIKNDSQQSTKSLTNSLSSNSSPDYTLIDLLPKQEKLEKEPNYMKNELKNFLKKQMSELVPSNQLVSSNEIIDNASYSSF